MFFTLFALVLTAHLISDFLLQTDKIANNKKELKVKSGWRAMFTHAVITFILNVAALYFLLDGLWPLLGAAAITAAHLGIDIIKDMIKCNKRYTLKFVLDQITHAAAIAAIVHEVLINTSQTFTGLYSVLKPLLLLPDWSGESDKILWTIITGLICIWGGAYLIRSLLNDLNINLEEQIKKPNKGNNAHTGKWIGILERIAILILIPLDQWAAVGLLLTAKSIARHKNMEDKAYAEYYLIGTLLSFIIAVAGGLLISGIWPKSVAALP